MATRSLNKVQLIGNLTRDPELRYTPQGTAVCTVGLATNRTWTTDAGEKKEEAEFHRLVAWNKLAELCAQLLFKGRRIYVEGRLQTRSWQAQDGTQRQTTEIVVSDMMILDSRRQEGGEEQGVPESTPQEVAVAPTESAPPAEAIAEPKEKEEKEVKEKPAKSKKAAGKDEDKQEADVSAEDIPF